MFPRFPHFIDTIRQVLWWVKISNPPRACSARSSRFADSQHSFAAKLEKCRTTWFFNRFVPWLQGTGTPSLPSFFLKLIIFKHSKPSAQTPTPPPSHLINFPLSSVMQRSFEIHRDCILLVRPFLYSISWKKIYFDLNGSENFVTF